LLHLGADINARNNNNATPLMQRILDDDFEIAEFLLQYGAHLYGENVDGVTAVEADVSEAAAKWCYDHGLVVEDGITKLADEV
jgi:ankyrin repeat protein